LTAVRFFATIETLKVGRKEEKTMGRKRWVGVLALLLALAALSGCSMGTGAPKSFGTDGFTVTLEDSFREDELEPFSAYYKRRNMSLFALKEPFSGFEQGDGMTEAEYAQLIMEKNEVDSELTERDGLCYFSYFKEAARKDFAYYAFAFKGSDAYWLIQFAIPFSEREKLEDEVFSFAETVRVE
jgi:hypothetical protein